MKGPGVLRHNLSFHKGKGEAGQSQACPGCCQLLSSKENLGTGWDGEIRELGCSPQLSSCNWSQLQGCSQRNCSETECCRCQCMLGLPVSQSCTILASELRAVTQ